jgi:hypothetical protein
MYDHFVVDYLDLLQTSMNIMRVAANCCLVWHEASVDTHAICVKRDNVKHWSRPFRIDRLGSFHVTMR